MNIALITNFHYKLKLIWFLALLVSLLILPFGISAQTVESILSKADEYNKQKSYSMAIQAYKQVISFNPDNIRAYNGLGLSYSHLEKYVEAIEAYKQAIGNLKKASSSINKNNNLAVLYSNLGTAYLSNNNYSEATEAYQESIRCNMGDFAIYNLLGQSLIKLELYQEAINAYKQASELNPTDAASYIGLAVSYIELKMYAEASSANKMAIRYNLINYNNYLPTSDPGTDLATVIAPKTTIQQSPSYSSSTILKVSFGDTLVLLDPIPKNNWYNIFEIKSGKEGWIETELVKLYFTSNRNSGPVLQAEKTSKNKAPEITINNDSDRNLTVKIGNQEHTLEAHSKRKITITAGNYRFYGSSPAVIPAIGEKSFLAGYSYNWTFYIGTKN